MAGSMRCQSMSSVYKWCHPSQWQAAWDVSPCHQYTSDVIQVNGRQREMSVHIISIQVMSSKTMAGSVRCQSVSSVYKWCHPSQWQAAWDVSPCHQYTSDVIQVNGRQREMSVHIISIQVMSSKSMAGSVRCQSISSVYKWCHPSQWQAAWDVSPCHQYTSDVIQVNGRQHEMSVHVISIQVVSSKSMAGSMRCRSMSSVYKWCHPSQWQAAWDVSPCHQYTSDVIQVNGRQHEMSVRVISIQVMSSKSMTGSVRCQSMSSVYKWCHPSQWQAAWDVSPYHQYTSDVIQVNGRQREMSVHISVYKWCHPSQWQAAWDVSPYHQYTSGVIQVNDRQREMSVHVISIQVMSSKSMAGSMRCQSMSSVYKWCHPSQWQAAWDVGPCHQYTSDVIQVNGRQREMSVHVISIQVMSSKSMAGSMRCQSVSSVYKWCHPSQWQAAWDVSPCHQYTSDVIQVNGRQREMSVHIISIQVMSSKSMAGSVRCQSISSVYKWCHPRQWQAAWDVSPCHQYTSGVIQVNGRQHEMLVHVISIQVMSSKSMAGSVRCQSMSSVYKWCHPRQWQAAWDVSPCHQYTSDVIQDNGRQREMSVHVISIQVMSSKSMAGSVRCQSMSSVYKWCHPRQWQAAWDVSPCHQYTSDVIQVNGRQREMSVHVISIQVMSSKTMAGSVRCQSMSSVYKWCHPSQWQAAWDVSPCHQYTSPVITCFSGFNISELYKPNAGFYDAVTSFLHVNCHDLTAHLFLCHFYKQIFMHEHALETTLIRGDNSGFRNINLSNVLSNFFKNITQTYKYTRNKGKRKNVFIYRVSKCDI